jgi:hypothetical protein
VSRREQVAGPFRAGPTDRVHDRRAEARARPTAAAGGRNPDAMGIAGARRRLAGTRRPPRPCRRRSRPSRRGTAVGHRLAPHGRDAARRPRRTRRLGADRRNADDPASGHRGRPDARIRVGDRRHPPQGRTRRPSVVWGRLDRRRGTRPNRRRGTRPCRRRRTGRGRHGIHPGPGPDRDRAGTRPCRDSARGRAGTRPCRGLARDRFGTRPGPRRDRGHAGSRQDHGSVRVPIRGTIDPDHPVAHGAIHARAVGAGRIRRRPRVAAWVRRSSHRLQPPPALPVPRVLHRDPERSQLVA